VRQQAGQVGDAPELDELGIQLRVLGQYRQALDVGVEVAFAADKLLRLALKLGAKLGILGDALLEIGRRLAQPADIDLLGGLVGFAGAFYVVEDLGFLLRDAAAEKAALFVVAIVVRRRCGPGFLIIVFRFVLDVGVAAGAVGAQLAGLVNLVWGFNGQRQAKMMSAGVAWDGLGSLMASSFRLLGTPAFWLGCQQVGPNVRLAARACLEDVVDAGHRGAERCDIAARPAVDGSGYAK